jgi:uncharacterized protein HemX
MVVVATVSAAAAVASAYGAKKGKDAYDTKKKAKQTRKQAKYIFDKAERRLENARESTQEALETLGERKLRAWDEQVGRFVDLFGQLRNVEISDVPDVESFEGEALAQKELREMEEMSLEATEAVKGGSTAVGSGALAGIASYGGASMAATASTGTAISSLSGAAAQSATLAWFGGGSLAAGGAGVAGGAAVLGGIGAAPVLAVGGALYSAKQDKNLSKAKEMKAEAKQAAEEMKTAQSVAEGIGDIASQYESFIGQFVKRMDQSLDALESVIEENGPDYQSMPEEDRRVVHVAVQFTQVLKSLLTTPLLNENGSLAAGAPDALESGRSFLKSDFSKK